MKTWPTYDPAADHSEPTTAIVTVKRVGLLRWEASFTYPAPEVPRTHSTPASRVPPLNPSFDITGSWMTRRGAVRGVRRFLRAGRVTETHTEVVAL